MLAHENPCGAQDCNQVVIWCGSDKCEFCAKSYCAEHLCNEEHHPCHKAVRENDEEALEMLMNALLVLETQHLKDGKDRRWIDTAANIYGCDPSEVEIGNAPRHMKGGIHQYYKISMPGCEWLLRRRDFFVNWESTNTRYYEDVRYAEDSEKATLDVLAKAGVLVPTIQGDFVRVENPFEPKSDYCIFNLMAGRHLESKDVMLNGQNLEDLPYGMTLNWIKSYAKESVKVSQIVFDQIGSLVTKVDSHGNKVTTVGQPCDWQIWSEGVSPDYSGVPLYSTAERYIRHLDLLLDLIIAKRIRYNASDSEIWYLTYLEAKTLIEKDPEMNKVESQFYLMHADNRMSQSLIDDEGNITAWLDWEGAIATTKAEAFSAPLAFYDECPRDNTPSAEDLALMNEYQHLGRPDLADCVQNGKKYQRIRDMFTEFRAFNYQQINSLQSAFLGPHINWHDNDHECFEDLKIRHADRPEWRAFVASRQGEPAHIYSTSEVIQEEDETSSEDDDTSDSNTPLTSSDEMEEAEVEGKENQKEPWAVVRKRQEGCDCC